MKRILLIATGGTIASAEDGRGLSPALSGEELAACVPEVRGLCDLDTLQLMNIDSTNMRPADWLRIARAIADRYADFDGFLVLHGTDTMAYTAAALSYLIPTSAKPIVLTGSQRPMTSSFTDAKLNLYQSLLYATDDLSRDVSIVFGGIAIAGTRARKQRTMSANAFTSVNFPPLAYIRNDHIVRAGAWGTGAHAQAGEPTPNTEPGAGTLPPISTASTSASPYSSSRPGYIPSSSQRSSPPTMRSCSKSTALAAFQTMAPTSPRSSRRSSIGWTPGARSCSLRRFPKKVSTWACTKLAEPTRNIRASCAGAT